MTMTQPTQDAHQSTPQGMASTLSEQRASRAVGPVLDVVVPVHNEQDTVAACIERLSEHLGRTFPYPWRITIADNASSDATPAVAAALAAASPQVEVVRLDQKGRGRALHQVWSASDAHVLAYMDVDLSTDLDALLPLVAPLLSGHSDVAIGSRLARGSRVVRGTKREFISQSYNLLLRATLSASFSDAQCGFKAIRADVAGDLLPYVQDTEWFFDTELLIVAQRCGLRIHEVPVDWFDDPASSVDVVRTALDDLAGMRLVRLRLRDGSIPVAQIAARIGRGRLSSGLGGQIGRFASVGALSTLLHLGLFAALGSAGMGRQSANLLALLVATVVNTAANRRWTFGATGRRGRLNLQAQGLGIFALTWAASAAALALLGTLAPGAPTVFATATVATANAVATIVKFALFRARLATPSGHFVTDDDAEPTSVIVQTRTAG